MTIFEVIRNNSLFGCLSDAEIRDAIEVRSLNGADAYVSDSDAHKKGRELIEADLMDRVSGFKSVKEGDWGETYNYEELKSKAQRIYDKYESKEESKPKGYKVLDVGVSFEQ